MTSKKIYSDNYNVNIEMMHPLIKNGAIFNSPSNLLMGHDENYNVSIESLTKPVNITNMINKTKFVKEHKQNIERRELKMKSIYNACITKINFDIANKKYDTIWYLPYDTFTYGVTDNECLENVKELLEKEGLYVRINSMRSLFISWRELIAHQLDEYDIKRSI